MAKWQNAFCRLNYFFLAHFSPHQYTQKMVYHEVQLGPSEGQMADLALGDAVTLSPKHFAGEVVFKLTTTQLKKIEKAKAAGRGCQLKLTPAQIKHMAQKGNGRFTDYLRSGVNYVKPIVRAGVAKGIDMGADFVSGKLADGVKQGSRYVKKKVGVDQEGNGWLGKLGKKIAHGGVDFVGDMLGVGAVDPGMIVPVGKPKKPRVGSGARPANVRKPGPARTKGALVASEQMEGAGWLGKLGKKLAHGGVDFVGDMMGVGASIPNPHANTNEALRAAMFQKKVPVAVGSGLKW
jgi:hypothetical protein